MMRFSPRLGLLLVLLFAGFGAIDCFAVESVRVKDISFFPPQFYVGDRVEAVLELDVASFDGLFEPEKLPESQWVEYHYIRLEHVPATDTQPDSFRLRLAFTAYVPGTVSLPVIDLGGARLDDYEILVHSLQPQYGSDLHELRPQMLLPGTQLILWLLSAFIILLPAAWLAFMQYGGSWRDSLLAWLRAGQPYRRLRSSLRRMLRLEQEWSAKGFYIELLTALRQYFTGKTGRDCMSATTYELQRILTDITDVSGSQAALQGMQEIFRFGDSVKFAGTSAGIELRREHLARVFVLAAQIEGKDPKVPKQVVEYVPA